MKYQLLLLISALLTPAVHAQDADSTFAAELLALEHAWADAEIVADTLIMRGILADTLIGTTFYGALIRDPAVAVGAVLDPKLSIRRIEQHDLEAHRITDDVAFVTGGVTMDWSYDGVALPDELRYTRVYRRRYGAWKVVALHVSPVFDPLAAENP